MAAKYRESISGDDPAAELKIDFFVFGDGSSFELDMNINGVHSGSYDMFKIGTTAYSFILLQR